MTTFEILTIAFYAEVVMIGYLIYRGIDTVIDNQQEMDSNLRKIDAGLDKRLEDISQQLDNIEDNNLDGFKKLLEHNESIENLWASDSSLVIKLLKELVDIEHKSDERNDNMFPFMQEIMSNYNPPCYSPNGICTNPQMDCINCPKRGTGGTWTTSTNIVKED